MQYLLNLVLSVCFYSGSSEGDCSEEWNRSVPFPPEGAKLHSFLEVFCVENTQMIAKNESPQQNCKTEIFADVPPAMLILSLTQAFLTAPKARPFILQELYLAFKESQCLLGFVLGLLFLLDKECCLIYIELTGGRDKFSHRCQFFTGCYFLGILEPLKIKQKFIKLDDQQGIDIHTVVFYFKHFTIDFTQTVLKTAQVKAGFPRPIHVLLWSVFYKVEI